MNKLYYKNYCFIVFGVTIKFIEQCFFRTKWINEGVGKHKEVRKSKGGWIINS